ncbi:MAG: alanine racemase [Kiritimatiellia bacterium]|nr:alanine racemase [Lentisphaerota bacterium]
MLHNYRIIDGWMRNYGADWTVVTKVLCGNTDVIRALELMGTRSLGDSRLSNLRDIRNIFGNFQGWYLRVPAPSSVADVVKLADVSLNSEISTLQALNEEAVRQQKTHRIIIMIELGDLREGILIKGLTDFYELVFNLSNIEVLGIGANFGCLSGMAPTADQFMQLLLYRELLELKFEHKLPLISAGSSAALPMILKKQAPRGINHFRIGEALFLGSDLINGGLLPELRDDVMLLQAEIAELKRKGTNIPAEAAGIAPFAAAAPAPDRAPPTQRGYRALISIGHLDTNIDGLTPVNDTHQIAGASSDITVVSLGDDTGGLKVGDSIEFRMNYPALLHLMNCRYIEKVITPSLDKLTEIVNAPGQEKPPTDAFAQ